MLKSLFESSIDKLNIPAYMKSAIKKINNICLEAEETSDNVKTSVEKVSKNQGMFNQHVSAEQAKAMYDAQQKENAAKSGGKPQTQVAKNDEPNAQKGTTKLKNDIMPKLIKEYGKDDPIITKLNDAIKLINDPKTLKEGSAKLRKEVYAQIIEDQGNNAPILQDIRDTIKIINTPDPKKEEPKKEEPKAEEPKAEEQPAQAAESSEQQNQPKANGEQTAQSPANAEQQAQAAESGEQQNQQKVNGEQTTQPAANTEQQTQAAESSEQQEQNNAKPAATNFKKGADVATVQFFLKATKPQTNLVCDGILGPKTITAIQQTTDIIPSGKMDQKTQEEFNRLLSEAKQKVIPIQKQLGVTADGLIGKQTLGAMQKANMDVASVFNKKPTAPQTQVAKNQGGNNANGAANQGNINLLDIKFDESKAQQQLKNKYISQKEYNIWKAFGIAPIYQRRYPKETQNQIAQILKETKKQQGGQQQASQQKGGQQKAGQQNALKEDVAVKTPDKTSPKGTKENPNTEYVSGTVSLMNMPKDEKKVYDEEYQKSLKANLKPGKNEQIAMDTADLDAKTAVLRYRKNKGRPTQQQSAQQKAGQQNGKQNVQQQPQQVAKQGNGQPAQPGGQSNAKNNDYYSKTTQNGVTTTISGGTVSYINLPPDEKKVYDDAEKKAIENYIKKGNSEWNARRKASMNANVAVIRYRQRKAKKTS